MTFQTLDSSQYLHHKLFKCINAFAFYLSFFSEKNIKNILKKIFIFFNFQYSNGERKIHERKEIGIDRAAVRLQCKCEKKHDLMKKL